MHCSRQIISFEVYSHKQNLKFSIEEREGFIFLVYFRKLEFV